MEKPMFNQYQRMIIREVPEALESQLLRLSLDSKKCGREVLREIIPIFEKVIFYIPFLVVKDKYQRYCKNTPD